MIPLDVTDVRWAACLPGWFLVLSCSVLTVICRALRVCLCFPQYARDWGLESIETLVRGTQLGVELECEPLHLPPQPSPACPGLGNKEQEPSSPEELSDGSAPYRVVRGPWVCQPKGRGPGALVCFLWKWNQCVCVYLNKLFLKKIYLFLALLYLCCCAGFSPVAMCGPLIAVASLVAELGCAGFRTLGSRAIEHRLNRHGPRA